MLYENRGACGYGRNRKYISVQKHMLFQRRSTTKDALRYYLGFTNFVRINQARKQAVFRLFGVASYATVLNELPPLGESLGYSRAILAIEDTICYIERRVGVPARLFTKIPYFGSERMTGEPV